VRLSERHGTHSLGGALGLWLVFLVGCKSDEPRAHHPRPVKAHRVAPETRDGGLRYSASLHPQQEIQLAFKVSGYVSDIQKRKGADGRQRDLQQGDRVRRGSVLATLRDADALERVHAARAQHAEALATFRRTELDLDRATRLYASKSMTRPDFDAATAGSEAARARVDAAAAELRAAEIAFEDCTLVAPIDGVVLGRKIEVGTLASPGQPAFVLADVSRLEAVFGVPAEEIGHLTLGDSLPVRIEGWRPFRAQITALSPSADAESRVFQVEVAIPNPQNELRTGMIVTVLVPRGAGSLARAATVVVPLGAIVRSSREADAYEVFVLEDSGSSVRARRRPVRLGDLAGDDVTVEHGLVAGEQIVGAGATLLQDGEAVRVIP
jgi:RND family efflux transporter MFP subunit